MANEEQIKALFGDYGDFTKAIEKAEANLEDLKNSRAMVAEDLHNIVGSANFTVNGGTYKVMKGAGTKRSFIRSMDKSKVNDQATE